MIEGLAARGRAFAIGDGEILVSEGDEADEVFVVLAGTIEASVATHDGRVVVGTIGPGQVIGEITVVAGGRRTATLRGHGGAEVLSIPRPDFEHWLDEHPSIADEVSEQARERIDRSQVATMVAQLMGTTDSLLVQEIVDRVAWRRLEAGETLFEQGDDSDAAYFVVGGRVMVLVRADDGEQPVRELGRGEVVGELGLLDSAPRSATVRAIRDTTLAAFPTSAFEELVSRHPALMLHVTRGILTRLRVPPRRLVDRAAALTVAVTAPIEAGPIVAGLAAEIARFGRTRHLSSRRVDELLNRTDIAQATVDNVGVPRLAEFLHEADVGNDHVVLETDHDMTPWSRRALRQADRVVIVASPHPDRDERRRIQAILDTLADVGHVNLMLALVHPGSTDRPHGTARLVAELGVDEVVHLRAGSADDIARLGRLASGNGVGLVLSGGGARGFAHIGAHRALLDAGIPVDHVAGSSIGAPIAGGIALGLTGDALLDATEQQFHRLLDYTLPVVSLVKGERITRSIEATFGDWDIEDLWLPYYCVSTNLTKSRLEVHRRGSTALAVRASVAIPGVLPPVPHDGDLLVDGGVLNNLPVQMMRSDGTVGTIIAVDVAPPEGPRARSDYGLSVSGLRALAASVTKRGPSYPSVSAVLLRSMLTGAVSSQQEALRDGIADLVLPLHLPGIGLLEFERVRPVAEAGYEASVEAIAAWARTRPELGRAA